MVEYLVDPLFHNPVDVTKVDYHSPVVQILRRYINFDFAVVPMKILAFAAVIQQAMAIAEMDFLRDFVNISLPCRLHLPALQQCD